MKSGSGNCRRVTAALSGLVMAMMFSGAHAEDEIRDCLAIEDDAERLACFDAVASSGTGAAPEVAADEPAPAPAPAAAPKAAPAPEQTAEAPEPAQQKAAEEAQKSEPGVLTDEYGQETMSGDIWEGVEVRGHVERCEQGRSRKYVFYFDNGQIWRQKGNVRVSWRECDFDVIISKTAFGYALVKVGDTRKVRVDRVK